jgi:archaellum biogenesis ATPase FlaH
MIAGLSADQFAEILHQHLSPTSPIQSQEHLFGRERQLEQIEQALYAPGRSVFIYGDRGVGKTSLAQTVAYSHQSVTHEPVLIACDPQSSFSGLMRSAIKQLGDSKPRDLTTTHKLKIGYKGLGIEAERTRHEEELSEETATTGLNEVIALLLETARTRRNASAVVVIDEFDRLTSDTERACFADFIKQLGDQRVPIRFVFCGVAESLQKLLGAHGSCYRYLDGIELKTLTYDARFEIIDNAAKALGVRVHDRPRMRIAAISDGFPHYIHRMCEQLFWQMFNDRQICDTPTAAHYQQAVALSVLRIEQHLRVTYDQAVMKDAPGYEQVLWAVADHSDLIRNTEVIYDSYCELMNGSDEGITPLERQTVVARLNSLKGKGSGHILASERKGWYHFRESIMRGYVRLRAEEQGCELALDYAASSRVQTPTWRTRPARRGNFGTKARDWQKLQYPD